LILISHNSPKTIDSSGIPLLSLKIVKKVLRLITISLFIYFGGKCINGILATGTKDLGTNILGIAFSIAGIIVIILAFR